MAAMSGSTRVCKQHFRRVSSQEVKCERKLMLEDIFIYLLTEITDKLQYYIFFKTIFCSDNDNIIISQTLRVECEGGGGGD